MVDTLHPPLSVIESWPKPNYIDPETRGPALVYICIIFAAIGILTGAARVYSRLFITKAPGIDDLLVVVAIGFTTALTILVIVGNKLYYSGRHIWDVPPSSTPGSRLNIWISLWCYVIALTLIKVSVLLFYRRLSVKFSRAFLIATWVGIIYNVLYFFSFGLCLLLICQPVHAYWDGFDLVWASTHKFHCAPEHIILPASSALSVVGDFYSTALPLVLVYNLQIPRRQKFALYGLFALGFTAVAAGIVRSVVMYNLLNVDYDNTWELWLTWVWAVVELYLGLFAASAPSLKPFLRHFFVESVNSFRGSRNKQANAGSNATFGSEPGNGVRKYVKEAPGTEIELGASRDIERNRLTQGAAGGVGKEGFQQSWTPGDWQDPSTEHLSKHVDQDVKGIPMRGYTPNDNGGKNTQMKSPQNWPLQTSAIETHHQPREFLPSSRQSVYSNT